jgi:hypothetical protein
MSDLPKEDKLIIEQLEFCDNYAAAFRLKELKKQNTNLKRELTKLKKRQANEASKQPDTKALALNSVRLSLLECKNEIAETYGKDDWNDVLQDFEYGLGISKMIGFEQLMDEVAKLYAGNEA